MKTSIRNMIASVTLALALAIPAPALPQSRRGDRQHNRTERPQPEQHGNRRPDRPGNRQPDRPRPNRPGNFRPGRPQSGRPATPPPARPGHVRPTPPQPPHNWSRPAPPPPHRYRVPRPIPRRPVAPPPGYRPYVHAPALRSILGITFGTVYASALTYLFNSGYTIDGYADNTIYLSDVTLLGSGWPLATLYCNNSGRLASAQFSYYTGYSSLSRYNQIYNLLCGTYGSPLSLTADGIARQAMWYGGGGTGYITLEFYFYNGSYYTTLSVST